MAVVIDREELRIIRSIILTLVARAVISRYKVLPQLSALFAEDIC